jgi:hypothetical protein
MPSPTMPAVLASERFTRRYLSASPGLQRLIEGTVRDAVGGILSDLPAFKRKVDRVARLKESVLELKVTGGHRLLAQATVTQLDLLAVGEHELTGRYDVTMLAHDQRTLHPAPPRLVPREEERLKLIVESLTRTGAIWANELSPEWTYYLADPQYGALVDIALHATGEPFPGEAFIFDGWAGNGQDHDPDGPLEPPT